MSGHPSAQMQYKRLVRSIRIFSHGSEGMDLVSEPQDVDANLPWATELVLVGTMWVDLGSGISGTPGGLIECTVLGVKGDISCTGATSFVGGGLVENETGGVLAEAEPENSEVTPTVKCTSPLGEGEGLVFNDVAGLGTSSAGTLSISEP